MKWQENLDAHLEKRVKNFRGERLEKGEKLNKTIIMYLPNYSNLDIRVTSLEQLSVAEW
jgi:hypothetical protein